MDMYQHFHNTIRRELHGLWVATLVRVPVIQQNLRIADFHGDALVSFEAARGSEPSSSTALKHTRTKQVVGQNGATGEARQRSYGQYDGNRAQVCSFVP